MSFLRVKLCARDERRRKSARLLGWWAKNDLAPPSLRADCSRAEGQRRDDYDALGDQLSVYRNIQDIQTTADDAEKQNADNRLKNGSFPALKARSAQNDRGDDVQFGSKLAESGRRGVET